jgi:hypothetical protein
MLTVGQFTDHLEELVEGLAVELAGLPREAQEAAIFSFEKSLREESTGSFRTGNLSRCRSRFCGGCSKAAKHIVHVHLSRLGSFANMNVNLILM